MSLGCVVGDPGDAACQAAVDSRCGSQWDWKYIQCCPAGDPMASLGVCTDTCKDAFNCGACGMISGIVAPNCCNTPNYGCCVKPGVTQGGCSNEESCKISGASWKGCN
ncbi:MAG: hypothetical protein HY744_03805 [Deltaproteobacteria bacterium]|nr:hypothetical protein [Deltaproteobacteria bacterium]